MEFRIGNSLKLGGNSKYYLSSPVLGLDSPAIRNGDGVWAGRDGGYMSTQLYGTRTITLSGFYVAETCEERESLRKNLFSKLRIRYNYPIFFTGFNGGQYFTEGYLTEVKSDISGPLSGEYQITFLCPDPLIYDGGDGINISSTWIENAVSAGTNTVMNPGVFEYAPEFEFEGAEGALSLVNETTGKSFTVEVEPDSGSEGKVIIDMKKRLVTLDGVSINHNRTLDSSWWVLESGGNDITITGDFTSGKVRLRKGYIGV